METHNQQRNHLREYHIETAKWLAGVAVSPVSADYLPAHYVPRPPDGTNLADKDLALAAELATNFVSNACVMYLPKTKTFYFQRIPACFRVVPIGGRITTSSN